jgi:hypothetical protein
MRWQSFGGKHCNGSSGKSALTETGKIELAIPRNRQARFDFDSGLHEDGAQGFFRHVAGVVGNGCLADFPLRIHSHGYHGVLASKAPQRAQVMALAASAAHAIPCLKLLWRARSPRP